MKKSGWILILCVVALVGVGFWLLGGTNPEDLQRRETIVDVQDTFEK